MIVHQNHWPGLALVLKENSCLRSRRWRGERPMQTWVQACRVGLKDRAIGGLQGNSHGGETPAHLELIDPGDVQSHSPAGEIGEDWRGRQVTESGVELKFPGLGQLWTPRMLSCEPVGLTTKPTFLGPDDESLTQSGLIMSPHHDEPRDGNMIQVLTWISYCWEGGIPLAASDATSKQGVWNPVGSRAQLLPNSVRACQKDGNRNR